MTRVVVDASVLLAALIADGPTRAVLLGPRGMELYVPEVVIDEVQRHLPAVSKKAGVALEVVSSFLVDVLAHVQVVPTELFSRAIPGARTRCEAAHASNDEAYVALADVLGAPIWTYDKDFRRVAGLRCLTTRELREDTDDRSPPRR